MHPPSWVSPLWAWVPPLFLHSPPNPACSSREPNLSTMKWHHAARRWSHLGLSLFLPLVYRCQQQHRLCAQEATGSTLSLPTTSHAPETAPPQGARGWRTKPRTCGTPHTAPGSWKTSEGRKALLTHSPCHSQAPHPPTPTHRLHRPTTQPQSATRQGVTVPTAPILVLLASALPHLPLLPVKLHRACPPIRAQQAAQLQKLAWTWLNSRVSPVATSTMPMMSKATRQRACLWLFLKPQKPSQTPVLPPVSPQGPAWDWRLAFIVPHLVCPSCCWSVTPATDTRMWGDTPKLRNQHVTETQGFLCQKTSALPQSKKQFDLY